MNWLSKYLKIGATSIAVALLVATAHAAQAVTFTESGDAGQTLATAAVITPGNVTGTAGTPLTSITGALTTSNADLFQIFITGTSFTASTVGGSTIDTQLFLFNSSGLGIFTNDDVSGSVFQSAFTVNGLTAGIYYLGISGFNYDPLTAGVTAVFPTANPVSPGTPLTGTGVLASWGTSSTITGAYTIALTGAAPVPEPSSVLGLIALGGLGGGAFIKRRKKITIA